MEALPESWQQLLRDSHHPLNGSPLPALDTDAVREFSAGSLAPEELTFTRIYKLLIRRKLEGISFNNLLAALQARLKPTESGPEDRSLQSRYGEWHERGW